jgi:hydrogenase maturation protease
VGDVLVVGYGSDLRGDDAAGRQVVRELESLGIPGVTAVEVHQLTPELAAVIAGHRRAVFVDAGAGIDETTLTAIEPDPPSQRSTHHATPAGLLSLSESVFGHLPEGYLVTVPAEQFSLGSGLSPPAQRGVEDALWVVVGLTVRPAQNSSASSHTSTGLPTTSSVARRSGAKPRAR